MIILGIDSASDSASCSICEDEKLLCEFTLNTGKTHSENLMSLISDMMYTAGKKSNDIDMIAVCSGPGSYNGLRSGAAVAKSIAHVNNCNICGVSSLYAF